jgi:hypothetical protein
MKNEPAFPTHLNLTQGMTLRDYFAAKAMQSVISSKNWTGNMEATVKDAYDFADLMLKAREA